MSAHPRPVSSPILTILSLWRRHAPALLGRRPPVAGSVRRRAVAARRIRPAPRRYRRRAGAGLGPAAPAARRGTGTAALRRAAPHPRRHVPGTRRPPRLVLSTRGPQRRRRHRLPPLRRPPVPPGRRRRGPGRPLPPHHRAAGRRRPGPAAGVFAGATSRAEPCRRRGGSVRRLRLPASRPGCTAGRQASRIAVGAGVRPARLGAGPWWAACARSARSAPRTGCWRG